MRSLIRPLAAALALARTCGSPLAARGHCRAGSVAVWPSMRPRPAGKARPALSRAGRPRRTGIFRHAGVIPA